MLSANKFCLGISNELLFIIIVQGATKMRPVKVGVMKKIFLRTTTGRSRLVATSLRFQAKNDGKKCKFLIVATACSGAATVYLFQPD